MVTSAISEASLNVFREGLSGFVTFDEREWVALKPYLNAAILKKKDHFAVKGKICHEIGFIIKGSVRYYHVKDGLEITGYFSFEKEFVSSYKSYLTQQPGMSYIQALEPTELIVISYTNMQLLLNNPLLAYKMERFGRRVAEHYICCYEERITSFLIQTPEERYIHLLENEGNIMLRVPQHYIANFLGITPVSLSRIRKRTLVQG
jgi:CRP-like cAMP-binding protein